MNSLDNLLPTNKKFGLFFSAIFSIAFVYFFIKSNIQWYLLFGSLAIITILITLLAAHYLKPFNILWFKLSLILGKIINPIILGLIFFILITPISIVIRLMGRDEMKLKMLSCSSHWKERVPVGPKPESFKNQF